MSATQDFAFPGADEALIERINTRFDAERNAARPVTKADEIPSSYEMLTPEWFTRVLCADHPGAEVIRVDLDKPDDGSSNRRRIFLEYNDAGERAGLPSTVFGKASQERANRVMYGILGSAGYETTFYSEIRPRLSINAPSTYFQNYDPESFNSILLLKDLHGTANFCDYDTPIDLDRARGMLSLLAEVHSTFYGEDKVRELRDKLRTWPQHWANQLRLGMEEYSNRGFLAAEDVIPARLYARYEEIWPATMRAVAQHETLPQMLIHGDVHLKNWYITNEGQMGLSDWQGPTIGHWSRDLAYSMAAALTVENRRAWLDQLLEHYIAEMTARGVPMPSLDESRILFRRQLFTALAYWTVTLRHSPAQPDMQPEDATREFIRRIASCVDDLDALGSYDEA